MEVNEVITEVALSMTDDRLAMLGDEGRQAVGAIQRCRNRNVVQQVCRSCRSQSITNVYLNDLKLGDEHVKALADALRINKTVAQVKLSGNEFGDDGLKALASAMEVNEVITRVELYLMLKHDQQKVEMLSDEGRQAMHDIQRFCGRNEVQEVCRSCRSQSIAKVDLNDRKLGDEHVKALADALRVNHTVTEVDLRRNEFGDDGLKALADALRVNHTVTEVDLTWNNFGNEGLKALASAMEVNEVITVVNLFMKKNHLEMLSDEGRQAMQDIQRLCGRNKVPEVCQSCRSQRIIEVDVSDRKLGDEHVKALADALRVNHTVTKVDLNWNNFGNEGLKALASAMEVNEVIAVVDLCMKEDQLEMLSDEGRQAKQDIQRFCRRNKEKNTYTICIDKSTGAPLGISVIGTKGTSGPFVAEVLLEADANNQDGETLLIERINPGLVQDWNKKGANEEKVQVGDRIIEVNGINKDILQEVKKNQVLVLKLRRGRDDRMRMVPHGASVHF